MSIVDDLLKEAEEEFLKEANDQNGSPDTPAKQNGGGDILATAQEFLQQVEQFKASLGENAAQVSGDSNAQQQQVDPATGQPVAANPNAQGSAAAIAIIRPDGTQIKVASLMKIASLRGKKLFEEVE